MSPKPTPKDPWPEPPEAPQLSDEQLSVRRWRYQQARRAGMTFAEAELFADSRADIGHLRIMVKADRTIREIIDLLLL